MRHFKFILFIFTTLLCRLHLCADTLSPVLKYDSVIVKTERPTVLKEQEVFGSVDLGLAKTQENKDKSVWNRFWDWLGDLIFGNSDAEDKITLQSILIWTFVILGLLLTIWLFSRSEFGTFLRGNVKNTEFNFEDINEDISGIDFIKRIEQAKANNDLRLAIRWLYLKQLYILNEKAQISWQPYKTNMDYMNELSKSGFKQAFKDISKVYEYVWYGQYAIDQTNFNAFETQFKQFEAAISV